MADILYEITPLSDKDCFHIVDRHKSEFDYPLHRHKEYELNFVQNAAGVRRIVGDSIEEIGDVDMVLITGENLEHVWEQGNCKSRDIREITIQFSENLFSHEMLERNQFTPIRKMFESARNGISFPIEAIMKVYDRLDSISAKEGTFREYLDMLSILYDLASYEPKILSSNSFSHAVRKTESRRVQKIKEYIQEHHTEDLSLEKLSAVAGMSPTAFSRFFKLRTGKTLSNYIIDLKLGIAARALVDTTSNISEICYSSGFNNLSNFNRLFKQKRGMSPREFRSIYKKQKVLV